MILVLGSCLALMIGPLLLYLTGAKPKLIAALDGFVLTAVLGLVFVHIIPHAIFDAGSWAIAATFIGLLLPILLERLPNALVTKTKARPVLLVLALLALALHGAMDGVALVGHHHGDEHETEQALGIGIILHRIPLGLTLWWMARASLGRNKAVAVLVTMMTVTCLGYFAGEAWVNYLSLEVLGVFQALMGGAILHVALDSPPTIADPNNPSQRSLNQYGVLGVGLGIAVIWLIGQLHQINLTRPDSLSMVKTAWTLSAYVSKALLLTCCCIGVLRAVLSRDWLFRMERYSSFLQSVVGAVLGILLPICANDRSSVQEQQRKYRLLIPAMLPFLLAASSMALEAFLLSVPIMGAIGSALLVCFMAIGAILSGMALKPSQPLAESSPFPPSESVREAFHFAFLQYPIWILPWAVLGLGLASIAEPVLPQMHTTLLTLSIDVPIAALLGLLLYIGAVGFLPLGVVLLHKGFSAGALLAFLVACSATNRTLLEATQATNKSFFAHLTSLFVMSVLGGWLINQYFQVHPMDLHTWHQSAYGVIDVVAVGLMGLLILRSLLTVGPRGFVATVVSSIPNTLLSGSESHKHSSLSQ